MSSNFDDEPLSDDNIFFGKITLKEVKRRLLWNNRLQSTSRSASDSPAKCDDDLNISVKILKVHSEPNLLPSRDIGYKDSTDNLFSDLETRDDTCVSPNTTNYKNISQLNNTLEVIEYILNNPPNNEGPTETICNTNIDRIESKTKTDREVENELCFQKLQITSPMTNGKTEKDTPSESLPKPIIDIKRNKSSDFEEKTSVKLINSDFEEKTSVQLINSDFEEKSPVKLINVNAERISPSVPSADAIIEFEKTPLKPNVNKEVVTTLEVFPNTAIKIEREFNTDIEHKTPVKVNVNIEKVTTPVLLPNTVITVENKSLTNIEHKTPIKKINNEYKTPIKQTPKSVFKTPAQTLSTKKPVSSMKKTPSKLNAYQHIVSPVASYINNSPMVPLIKKVNPKKPLPGSSFIPKLKSHIPVKQCNKENIQLRQLAYKSAKETEVINLPDEQRLPQTQWAMKLMSSASKPTIITHAHRDFSSVKKNSLGRKASQQQEDSIADLSVHQADMSVCVQKPALKHNRRP